VLYSQVAFPIFTAVGFQSTLAHFGVPDKQTVNRAPLLARTCYLAKEKSHEHETRRPEWY